MTTKPTFGVSNGLAPVKGPQAIPVTLDFSTALTVSVNLSEEMTGGGIDFVQSVFVDNSDNPQPLTLRFPVTRQRVVIPAGAQGFWPVISTTLLSFDASTLAMTAVEISLLLLNVPMPLTQWGPISVTATTSMVPTQSNMVDRSGVIAAGGVSQQLAAANAIRKRILIQNPATEVESLFVNFGAAATSTGNSIELMPGGTFDSDLGPVSAEVINVIAATINHKYMAKEQ